jgi:8-oxo-dGTP diphosphatase
LSDVDFARWQPDEVATLTFIRRADEVLLIRKLRGHGAGKINGPGGKVEAGETPLAAAQRETREEVHLQTRALVCRAELRFQDVDGFAMRGFVFVTDQFTGTPTATAEAEPFWCRVDELPFHEMWDDDRLWLPRVLGGECVVAEFLTRADQVQEYRLYPVASTALESAALEQSWG